MARPIDPETGRKVPVVSVSLHDGLKLILLLLFAAPVALVLAVFVSPYLILLVLLVFVLWQAVRM